MYRYVCVCHNLLTCMIYYMFILGSVMKEDEDEKKEATGESSLGTKTLRNAQCLSSEGDHYVSSSWQ